MSPASARASWPRCDGWRSGGRRLTWGIEGRINTLLFIALWMGAACGGTGDGSIHRGPIASDDSYSIDQDLVLTVEASLCVLANDAESDGQPFKIRLAQGVAHGALAFEPDGSFVYT